MSGLPVEFEPAAFEEAEAAIDWYDAQSSRAAERFLAEIDEAVRGIGESPARGSTVEAGVRRWVLERFPYSIIYRVRAGRVEILAVARGRRQPGYWRDRM